MAERGASVNDSQDTRRFVRISPRIHVDSIDTDEGSILVVALAGPCPSYEYCGFLATLWSFYQK